MSLVWGFGCQADFVAIELPLECFFVRLKAAVSSPGQTPTRAARSGGQHWPKATGEGGAERCWRLRAPRQAWPGRESSLQILGLQPAGCSRAEQERTEGSPPCARILAPRPCIRLGPVGPRP